MEDSISKMDQMVIITNNPNVAKEGLKILYVNDAFTRISGYAQDEVIGLSPSLLQGPGTDAKSLLKVHDAIKNERSIRCEMLNYNKDKKPYWIELNLTPLSVTGLSCDYFIGYSIDISAYKKTAEVVLATEESLEFVLASAELGYWDFDLTENVIVLSPINDSLFGYKDRQEDWTYEFFLSRVVQEDKERVDAAFIRAMEVTGDYDVEFRCEWPDKSIHWLWAKGRFIKDEQNNVVRSVGIQACIDEKKSVQEKIYDLAYVDELTRLPNRAAFNQHLKNLMLGKSAKNDYKALLFLDLDDFKVVNDTLGHDVGDALLVKIAERFKENLSNIDIISRFGGDEFVMLISALSPDKSIAHDKVEQSIAIIRGIFKQPFHFNKHEFYTKTSIGVTLFSGNADDKFELLKQADLALYHAKSCGKNTHRFFDQQLQLDLIKRTELEKDLREALISKQLYLVYQPQVNLDKKVVGAEALIRWQHPTKGIISPAEFIPIAEDTGLIVPIGEWVLSEAIKFIKKWPEFGASASFTLSINISPVQFRHELFVEKFALALNELKHQPNKLKLEITENTVIENLEESLLKMNILKEQNVTFSLDDFGSGFSSLNYLKYLPINEIKIDKSFIDDIVQDKRNSVILNAIINIAAELNLNLIIEGVETIEQVTLLNNIGAKVYQGFYFSKPLSETDLVSFFESHS